MIILLIVIVLVCSFGIYEEVINGPMGQDDDNPYYDWIDDEEGEK